MARQLKVFRTHIGFDDLIVASASRKAALEAWGASAHLFTQGFAAETNEPALVKAALARPGMVLRRQFGSQGEFRAERPALRLVEAPAKAEPKAPAKSPVKKSEPAKPTPAGHAPNAARADSLQKHAKRGRVETERAKRRERTEVERPTRRERTEAGRAKRERTEIQRAERRVAETLARTEVRQREREHKEAAAALRRDLQSQLRSLLDERRQQLLDIDRREQDLSRERREIEQSFEVRIVALQRRLRKD